jgi:hypothetical protein
MVVSFVVAFQSANSSEQKLRNRKRSAAKKNTQKPLDTTPLFGVLFIIADR